MIPEPDPTKPTVRFGHNIGTRLGALFLLITGRPSRGGRR